jgi:hypothetical protein
MTPDIENLVAGTEDGVRVGDVDLDRLEILDPAGGAPADDDGAAGHGEATRQPEPYAGRASDDQDGAITDIHVCFLSVR